MKKIGVTSWWNNFTKQTLAILGYLTFFWLIHAAVISVVVFFHFILGHDLNIIDSWIIDEAWKVLIIAKIMAAIPVLKLCFLYSNDRKPIRNMLKSSMLKPRRPIWVVSFSVLILSLIIGGPEISENTNFQFFRFFWSFIGLSIFYLFDVLIFLSLQVMLPIKQKKRYLVAAIFGAVGAGVYIQAVPYAENLSFSVAFLTSFLCFLSIWRGVSWSDPLVFMMIAIAPMGALFGLDPVWSENFSYFYLSESITSPFYFVVFFVSFLYLRWNQKTWPSKVKY